MKVELLIQSNCELGEGPVWDHLKNELLWVDIEKKRLHFYIPETSELSHIDFQHRIGCAIPINYSEKYILGLQNGIAFFNRVDQSIEYISHCESEIVSNRFNDGKCDAKGRLWIGSMNLYAKAGEGVLYSVDNSYSVVQHLSGLAIPNGIAWSAGGKTMYFIDTPTRSVQAFNFDLITGSISKKTTCIEVGEKLGYPDGMCIDVRDKLWIANWGASCITRWDPESGRLLEKVKIPAKHVTSVCFGMPKMDTLFITTARMGLDQDDLKEFHESGSVFTYKPSVHGVKANYFNSN